MKARENRVGLAIVKATIRFATPLLLVTLALPVQAAVISLFNTGVNALGAQLALGSADSHWSVVAGPGITTPVSAFVLNNQNPSGLYGQSPASRWIWVNASGAAAVNSPYTFRLQFDLTGLDPSTAEISGAWGNDNTGNILLNGTTPEGTGAFSLAAYKPFANFDITGGFVSGVNTLDFQMTDLGSPGGLNVTNLSGSATVVPEPSLLAMLFAGALGLFVYARRRE